MLSSDWAEKVQCCAEETAWEQYGAGIRSRLGEQREPHSTPLFHTPRSSAFPMQMRIILNGIVFMLCFHSLW